MLDDLSNTLKLLPKGTSPCLQKLPLYPLSLYKITDIPLTELAMPLQFQAIEYAKELINVGRLIRQEITTLIPYLCMQLEPNLNVIDICAGQGVRSLQVLEYFNNTNGKGFIVSNVQNGRKLGNLKRVFQGHPQTKLMITCHDPVNYPILKSRDDFKIHEAFRFDRVICFPPSSNDAEIRKNPDIFREYNWKNAYNLHTRQLKILSKSVELCKTGGLIIYSVASMNPIECESVVYTILKKYKDIIELCDVNKIVQDQTTVKIRKGRKRWKILDLTKGVTWYKDYKEVPENSRTFIKESMFGDPYTNKNWEQEYGTFLKHDPLKISNCIRVYSHDQDSTGVFIAVFKKLKSEIDTIYDDFYELDPTENPKVKQHSLKDEAKYMSKWLNELQMTEQQKYEKDIKFVKYRQINEKQFSVVRGIYGISKEFDSKNLYCKSEKKIYYLDPNLSTYLNLRKGHRLNVFFPFLDIMIDTSSWRVNI